MGADLFEIERTEIVTFLVQAKDPQTAVTLVSTGASSGVDQNILLRTRTVTYRTVDISLWRPQFQ